MKKAVFSIVFSVILIFSFVSCALNSQSPVTSDSMIASLEGQLSSLKNEQEAYESHRLEVLESLEAKINALSSQAPTVSDPSTDSTADTVLGFKYTIEDDRAIITGFVGEEKNIVIPSSIDGYTVSKIADRAFADSKLKSVIVSDGIESIGWFAFDGCVFLSAVTIPQSVTSIGYSAFGSDPSELTIYCHNGSFALKFAQSFGLSYAVI